MKLSSESRFVVITKVLVKPECIETVAELFSETNPSLVASQKDWVSATFTVNRETNEITVMAFWKEDESYLEFSSSADFQHTMAQFARHFVAAPEVTINQILVDMSHDDL